MEGYTRPIGVTRDLIDALTVALATNPNQRLGQLLANLARTEGGSTDVGKIWNTYDEEWIRALNAVSGDRFDKPVPNVEPDLMDRSDYWAFVESTPPVHLYNYEVIKDDENHRWFTVAIDADDADEAQMRAVQVAKHLGSPEAIYAGAEFLNEVRGKRWAVQIEAW